MRECSVVGTTIVDSDPQWVSIYVSDSGSIEVGWAFSAIVEFYLVPGSSWSSFNGDHTVAVRIVEQAAGNRDDRRPHRSQCPRVADDDAQDRCSMSILLPRNTTIW